MNNSITLYQKQDNTFSLFSLPELANLVVGPSNRPSLSDDGRAVQVYWGVGAGVDSAEEEVVGGSRAGIG